MDVRCERCGTDYEFDEARISEAGVAVKCTTCNHVFKVRKPSAQAASAVTEVSDLSQLPSPGEKQRDWKVRQPNGNVFTFRELTTLQRWIVERKVFRDDEISLTGETWKRLGNIPELASFFQVVEAADRAALLAASAPAVHPVRAQPAPPAAVTDGTPAWMAAPTPAAVTQPAAPAPTAPAPAPAQAPQHAHEPAFARGPAAPDLDDADLAVVRGGGKGKLIGGLVAVVALAAGGYFYVQQQSTPPEAVAETAVPEPAPAEPAPPEPPPAVAVPEPVPETPTPVEPAAAAEPTPAVAVAEETKAEPVPAAAVEPVAAKEEEKKPEEKPAPAEPKAEEKQAAASSGVPKGRDFDWYIQQAYRMRERNKAKLALDYYARAEELNPNSPEPHAGMGYALLDLGNLSAAIQSFETALQKSPRYGDALLGLAEAWKEKRDKKKAIDYYRQYIEAVPNGPEVGVARNNIERLSQP